MSANRISVTIALYVVKLPGLRRKRELEALSQRDLATRAGVAASTVARLEQGDSAYPSTVRKLSEALNCEPSDLMGEQ